MPRWLQKLVDFIKRITVAYPKSVTVACNPNPPADQVTAYKFAIDGGTPVSSPTPSASLSVPAAGSHTFTAVAENAEGVSAPASLTVVFPAKPGVPTNLHLV